MSFLASPILAFLLITGTAERIDSQAVDPTEALDRAPTEDVLSKGPHGEEPSPASSLSLTRGRNRTDPGLKAKAAIVMHYMTGERLVAGADCRSEIAVRQDGKSESCAVTDAGLTPKGEWPTFETVLGLEAPQMMRLHPD